MIKKNYIDKIELILNISGKYITRKEKDMILDYVNYFKTKNNVIEDKNIELVKEIERLNNIINKAIEYLESYNTDFKHSRFNEAPISIRELGELLEILKGEGSNDNN